MGKAHFDVNAYHRAVQQLLAMTARRDAEINAERRRAALLDFIRETGLGISEFAAKAGITPTILYNFLTLADPEARTKSLAQKTYEKIAAGHGTTIAKLTGEMEQDQLRSRLLAIFARLSPQGKAQLADIAEALERSAQNQQSR